jgi:hypothetical protein
MSDVWPELSACVLAEVAYMSESNRVLENRTPVVRTAQATLVDLAERLLQDGTLAQRGG